MNQLVQQYVSHVMTYYAVSTALQLQQEEWVVPRMEDRWQQRGRLIPLEAHNAYGEDMRPTERKSHYVSGGACNTQIICMCKYVCNWTLSHTVSFKERYQIYKFHAHKAFQQGLPLLWFGGLNYGPNS